MAWRLERQRPNLKVEIYVEFERAAHEVRRQQACPVGGHSAGEAQRCGASKHRLEPCIRHTREAVVHGPGQGGHDVLLLGRAERGARVARCAAGADALQRGQLLHRAPKAGHGGLRGRHLAALPCRLIARLIAVLISATHGVQAQLAALLLRLPQLALQMCHLGFVQRVSALLYLRRQALDDLVHTLDLAVRPPADSRVAALLLQPGLPNAQPGSCLMNWKVEVLAYFIQVEATDLSFLNHAILFLVTVLAVVILCFKISLRVRR
mmetsp:Transcript_8477/g.21638  ORF Transcript_8477/g.21638 Transcript_8477/m.21638 type:complete len:265 (-) Transcript_8477:461-1255(-)